MERKMVSGSPKARSWTRPWRWAKTLFFVAAMLASLLLVCAPPVFVVVIDLLLPPALLSVSNRGSPPLSLWTLPGQLKTFDFRSSLIDLPMVSALRSFLILFAFLVCDGGRGLYVGITAFCSSASTAYVLIKAFTIYWVAPPRQEPRWILALAGRESPAIEALFLTSLALAIAHIAVAYRTSCRERRKLLVYRIDVEAVKIKGGLIKEDSKV
ncbi:hypothetical protein C4D60_Mb09t18260 [Musa balbisiana]|uniref:MENTAL domain-containing protein n=1 Tax=Musa balbisiana TaxID=52838 RepID=A0A4S8IH98_MUSBA|nr:hypothetical protein C4D60_Mb09t18260 [Musa balbisiana]